MVTLILVKIFTAIFYSLFVPLYFLYFLDFFFFLFNTFNNFHAIPSAWAKLVCSLLWYISILRFFSLSFLMWTSFLKSFLNLLLIQYYFCFSFLACGILAPRQRIKPALPALEDEMLTIWSNIGEVPIFLKYCKKPNEQRNNENFIWPAKSKISNILDLPT